jgi:hypothetical protein
VEGQAEAGMNDDDLVPLLLLAADSIERQQQTATAGIMRRAARKLAELLVDEPSTDRCERCGKPLEQKPTGRRRRFCSERCRRQRVGIVTMAS